MLLMYLCKLICNFSTNMKMSFFEQPNRAVFLYENKNICVNILCVKM